MELLKALKERRSINFFDPSREIPEKILFDIVETASLSPSSFNLQPWEVILVTSPEKKKALREAAFNQEKAEEASAVMIILANTRALEENLDRVLDDRVSQGYMKPDDVEKAREGPHKMYGPEGSEKRKIFAAKNAGFFAMSIMIAARGFGIETHPMDGFSEEKLRAAFGIPDDRLVPLLIAAGYPAPGRELLPRPLRRSPEEIIMREMYR